jgi:hypothetical protein
MSAGIWAFINLGTEKELKEQRAQEGKEMALLSARLDEEYSQNEVNVAECVAGYLQSTNTEERAKYSRNSESTLRKMKDYYQNGLPFDTYHFDSILASYELEIFGRKMTLVSASVNLYDEKNQVLATPQKLLLEKQEDGNYLVDWETAVAYQPSNWDSFIAIRSNKPHVFRLIVTESIDSGPYLYEFSDDKEYEAYRINIRGNADKYLIGYVKKGSVECDILKDIVKRNSKIDKDFEILTPMTLKLAFSSDAQSDQCVEIIEVISSSWFIP